MLTENYLKMAFNMRYLQSLHTHHLQNPLWGGSCKKIKKKNPEKDMDQSAHRIFRLLQNLIDHESLRYKHVNLRRLNKALYDIQAKKRLTVFPTETFNNFDEVIVKLRSPPETRELWFVILPYSSPLRILHFRLMKNGEAHKKMIWVGLALNINAKIQLIHTEK